MMHEHCTVTFKPGLPMEQRIEYESRAAGAVAVYQRKPDARADG